MLVNYTFIGFTEDDCSYKTCKPNQYYIPIGKTHKGSFGYKRKYHTHEGVDIYCTDGTEVISITDGIIIDKGWFTGQHTEEKSTWWNDTQYLAVKYQEYVIIYGEITPTKNIGDVIHVGESLGYVKEVLTTNKGRPTSMLHLEVHVASLYTKPQEWIDIKPPSLISPIELLKNLIKKERNDV